MLEVARLRIGLFGHEEVNCYEETWIKEYSVYNEKPKRNRRRLGLGYKSISQQYVSAKITKYRDTESRRWREECFCFLVSQWCSFMAVWKILEAGSTWWRQDWCDCRGTTIKLYRYSPSRPPCPSKTNCVEEKNCLLPKVYWLMSSIAVRRCPCITW